MTSNLAATGGLFLFCTLFTNTLSPKMKFFFFFSFFSDFIALHFFHVLGSSQLPSCYIRWRKWTAVTAASATSHSSSVISATLSLKGNVFVQSNAKVYVLCGPDGVDVKRCICNEPLRSFSEGKWSTVNTSTTLETKWKKEWQNWWANAQKYFHCCPKRARKKY